MYWTRVVEARFLRVARMLQGDAFQIDGFMIDPEMYALQGVLPGGVDYGDYTLGEFVEAKGAVAFSEYRVRQRQPVIDHEPRRYPDASPLLHVCTDTNHTTSACSMLRHPVRRLFVSGIV